MSGLEVFDKTTQLTHQWVNEVAKQLNIEDKRKAFQGLRATLHVLRDRLTVGEAANLGAELPILLSGFYYEGWKPEQTPTKERTKEAFIESLRIELRHYFQKDDAGLDLEQLMQAVFRVMADRVPAGEMQDVTGILPAEIKELFPEAVRT
ncbi:DUF2267 domain-containing protein [Phormidium tenue FACHB-886]|nr:DUF2267 domain-containing protein [Phormidium tenue FACHB-886]